MSKSQLLIAKPTMGGRLITQGTADQVSFQDYLIKRDWRRDANVERRREGHDYFWPNVSGSFAGNPAKQPFPNDITSKSVSLTRSGSTVTGTLTGHDFVVGEKIAVDGNVPYAKGTYTITAVTGTTFKYEVPPGTTTSTIAPVKSAEDINLIHLARHPNGKTAIIVGTKTRLFRFFSLESGLYFEATGDGAPYFLPPPGEGLPYYDENPADWVQIGSGFSAQGHRWEAVNIAGWAVFNNGVDLPVTFRLDENEVVPIYELRESGVGSVGTIAEFGGILMCADISVIKDEPMEDLFQLDGITESEGILASMEGNTVTANADFFKPTDQFKWIVVEDKERRIETVTDKRNVTVSGDAATVTNKPFTIRTKASQSGSWYSNNLLAAYYGDDSRLVGAEPGGVPAVLNQTIRFVNGFSSRIVEIWNDQQWVVADKAGDVWDDGLPYYLIDAEFAAQKNADYMVTAESDIFTPDMVGRSIMWDSGVDRLILEYINPRTVRVDSDLPVPLGYFGVENPATYQSFTEKSYLNRVQYRIIWSSNDSPRHFASSATTGSMKAGSNVLILTNPAKSFEVGDEIQILEAGVDGAALVGTILTIAANRSLTLDAVAENTVTNVGVRQFNAEGSISGYVDLEDDGSGIIRMLSIDDKLVVYKDTSFFLGSYTGEVNAPFIFVRRTSEEGGTLFYRYTLVKIGNAHLYAGRNSFYKWDISVQRPVIFAPLEFCKDRFFDHARLQDTDDIFGSVNTVTKEILFSFPSTDPDNGLLYDFFFETASTTSATITAAATVKRPESVVTFGETEDWFLMAYPQAVVLLYGKADENVQSFADKSEITYRRHLNPFDPAKIGYDSILEGGLSDFGNPDAIKALEDFTPFLSSWSSAAKVKVEIFGCVNGALQPELLDGLPALLDNTPLENTVVGYWENYLFKDRLTVSGFDNPCGLAQRQWRMHGANTKSMDRVQ